MNSNNLFEAHREWRERKPDERFWSLKELHEVTLARHQASVESRVVPNTMTFSVADNNNVVLQGAQSLAVPTHWAFNQMCDLFDAPAPWIRKLPATLAADSLNFAAKSAPREQMAMMWANGGNPGVVRCFTTLMYSRLWDSDVVQLLRQMTQDEQGGWHRPPAMTDDKYPSGIYASDRNMFVFLVNEQNRIEDGDEGGLARGFFCWNSEVRQMSFGFKAFLYKYVCGNHIVWGAENLFDLRMIHIGQGMSYRAQRELGSILGAYISRSTKDEQVVIDAARVKQIGDGTRQSAIDWLSTRGKGNFGQWQTREAEKIVVEVEKQGKDPTNLWNLVNGATRVSQERGYTDERTNMDRKAGRMLEVVF